MFEFIQGLFDSGFMPHGHCYQWRTDLVWLHAFSDSIIALSYYMIPIVLVVFVQKRRDLAFRWMFVLFGAFILSCGTTHLLEVYTIWHGTYRLTGVVKLATGLVSMSTALLLIPLMPRALQLPSPTQLNAVNETLQQEIRSRRNIEQALRESEERFRLAFDHAQIGKALVAPDGRWIAVNPKMCEIVGYTEKELQGRTFQDITYPDDLEADLKLAGQLLEGTLMWYQMEKRYIHKNGAIVWTLLTGSLVRDPDGTPRYFIAEVQDISRRKEAEEALRETNRTLELRNKELQDFAYVASHDLQEPLRKIATFAALVQEDYSERVDDTGRHYLDRIKDSSIRMSELLNSLLDYSRITSKGKPFTPVNLNDIAAGVLSDLELTIQETDARIEIDPLPTIEADSTQIRQMLQNLIGNALKFRQPGMPPAITVRAQLDTVDLPERREKTAVCRLFVIDNGIGFDEKYLDRIFLPFERLHGPTRYAGTGMGLAICRRIVERHGGTITAQSAEGRGTVMIVTLPVNQGRS